MSRLVYIHQDEDDFLKMAKGRIRKDLAKYLKRGTIPAGIRGKKQITIPLDWFEIPSFRYGFPKTGVGQQGGGEPGDDLGPIGDDEGSGGKEPGGKGGGPVTIDIDVTPEEFKEFFQETLELPNIKPKGDRTIKEEYEKYNTLARTGPRSQIHDDRTYEEALRRAIATGLFKPPDHVVVIPEPKDFWYKSWSVVKEPKNNAVVIYIRDISGSMGINETRAARYLCGLCTFWLSQNYDGLEVRYIVHHGEGWEVQEEEFFSIRSGGGTEASKGHDAAYEMIDKKFSPSEWNIYIVYLSDGFNSSDDDVLYEALLREKLLPICNMYDYGQITFGRPWWGAYERSGSSTFSGPGTIGKILEDKFRSADNIALAEIKSDPEEMYGSVIDAIKAFFKKGK